jgi:transcriptional regulator with XRE-family HTH domain
MKRPAQSRQQTVTLQLLVRLRAAAGVNQTTLAFRLGITQSEVSKFERGERALDERRLRAWLDGLKVEWTSFADALDQTLKQLDPDAQRDRCERAPAAGASVEPNGIVEVPDPADFDHVEVAGQPRRERLVVRLALHDAPYRLVDFRHAAREVEGH